MTSNRRQPQNMKSGISHQPLVGSYSNLKLKLLGSNQTLQRYQMKTTSNRRQPQNKKSGISLQPLVKWLNVLVHTRGSDISQCKTSTATHKFLVILSGMLVTVEISLDQSWCRLRKAHAIAMWWPASQMLHKGYLSLAKADSLAVLGIIP